MPGNPSLQLSAPLDTRPTSVGPWDLLYTTRGEPESPGQGPPKSFPMAHILPGAICCLHCWKLSFWTAMGARFSLGVGNAPSKPHPPTQAVTPGPGGLRAKLIGRILVDDGTGSMSSRIAISLVNVRWDQNAQSGHHTPLKHTEYIFLLARSLHLAQVGAW